MDKEYGLPEGYLPPLDARELLQRYAAGERYFRGADLRKVDLGESQLQNVRLSHANLQGAYLAGAQLQDADLFRAWLQEANLVGAQLQGAYLVEAHLQKADLRRAQLQRADLRGANLQGANLSNVRGLTWEQVNSASTDRTTRLPKYLKASNQGSQT